MPNILERLGTKGADISALADQLIKNSEQIPEVVEALQVEQSSKKYAYEKVLRLISERRPELTYSFFDIFVRLLDHENNFLKWGAIVTVANLTPADTEDKFKAIFKKYYAPINGPTMIAAANIIGSSITIARAKPELTKTITREILKVEKAKYQMKGKLSPECRNVAIGQAMNSFNELYTQIENKTEVYNFVKRQLKNTRKQVAQKAEQFIRKHRKP